ncbi:DUF416 family protein [Lacihabitans soyangensis]|uniref:DUF416 family protein n=1 Tax=Lacihabitans soyangensis TaxID=869394 RepID=A0AAE3GZD1_9BACT|nr:DUF416 family protein [Lacihabitans soyangensis]MCP9761988.1 DUF416 family protein [Lacihabitans soyangensis]
MGLFYRATDKEILKDRNKIITEVAIPSLFKNGLVKSPFLGIWFGEYDKNIRGYSYELCRLSKGNLLEILEISVLKGEPWIKIHINIFILGQAPKHIEDLKGIDGINFHLPPNSNTKMRLRDDDYKGPPLFYMLFLPEHKLGTYFTKSGYESELEKLKNLIKSDLENIDSFIKRWHELHTPLVTDWEGNPLKNVKHLNSHQKVLFACILSTRLIENYRIFSLKFGFGSTQVLTNIIDNVVDSISKSNLKSLEEIDKMIVEIENITPDTEDFDSVMVSFALDACVSVTSTSQFLKELDDKWIEGVKVCTFDSLDKFIQEKLNLTPDDIDFELKIANHEIMKKESLFQQNLINEILDNRNDKKDIFLNFSKTPIFDLGELE